MAVVRTGETEYEQELSKWEKPYRYEPFPKMVYRGVLKANGKHDFDTRIVNGERELSAAKAEGWVESPDQAVSGVEAQEAEISQAAAENAYKAKRMSAKAQKELAAIEAATHRHVAE
jgi:hypothetical protein